MVGRLTTGLLMALAAAFTPLLENASSAFQLLLSIGAGTGLLYLLRWFWWRINAFSEIAAMASSFLASLGFFVARKQGVAVPEHAPLLGTVAATTIVWIAVTLMTRPTQRGQLLAFYRKVRPAGPGWAPVAAEAGPLAAQPDSMAGSLLGWVLGCAFVYAALFGTGSFLYGNLPQGAMWLAVFVASGAGLLRLLPRLWAGSSTSGN
jgi:Na+/proline symporter